MRISLIEIGFYKEQYDREQTRKNDIDNSIGLPSTLLTILVGGGLYLLKNSKFINNGFCFVYPNILILSFCSLYIISICTSIIFLMKIYANNLMKYLYLPSPSDLLKRESELYNHYLLFYKSIQILNPEEESIKSSKQQFEEDLLAYYVNFASKNQALNDSRLLDLYKARRFLILSILFIGIFGILSAIN